MIPARRRESAPAGAGGIAGAEDPPALAYASTAPLLQRYLRARIQLFVASPGGLLSAHGSGPALNYGSLALRGPRSAHIQSCRSNTACSETLPP